MSDLNGWNKAGQHPPLPTGGYRLSNRHVEDQLAAYTANELSAVERSAVERHLAGCPACQGALAEVKRIRALLASLASPAGGTIAGPVLERLPVTRGGGAGTLPSPADEPPTAISEGPACPVPPEGGVPSPVLRLEPRHMRGRPPSARRRWTGTAGRDETAMEQNNPTRAGHTASPTMATGRGQQADMRVNGRRPRSFAPVAAAVAVIALGAGVFGLMSHRPTLAVSGVGGQPHTMQPAIRDHVDLPANSTLDGMSMVSPNDGWAVGTVFNAPNGMGGMKSVLLAHYDGHAWTTSPDSDAFAFGDLISVSMDSADDGWATGSISDTQEGGLHGLVLHYTGGHWRAVDLSATGFIGGGEVHMVSADEGWIYAPVGAKTSTGQFGPDHKTLILHYSHGAWSLFGTLPGDALVSMLSASDGWAATVVTHAILRYQNGVWTQTAAVAGQPLAIVAISPSEVWLAGVDPNTQSAIAMRYDGRSWAPVSLPGAAQATPSMITSAAPGDIWIFGQAHTATQPKIVGWHYSADQWTLVDLNFKANLTSASMASPTSGWVTGNGGYNSAALMHYDNGVWTTMLGN